MKNQIASVDFRGHTLTVITNNKQRLVAMKPIVESIGLDWKSQYSRIQRHPVLKSTTVIMTTVAQDGKQRELLCLPLEYLNGWLFGVDVNRVREEIRDTLIQYQRECYAVLAAYWQTGEPKLPQRKTQPKALPSGLTIDQQDAIKAMVKARVEILPKKNQAKGAITCWSALKSKFGCTYKEISPDLYPEAVSLVARIPLEGEPMPKDGLPTLIGRRWLISYDNQGKERVTEVPEGAAIMTHSQLLKWLASPERIMVDADELFQFITAASERLRQMHGYQAHQLRQARDAGFSRV